MVMFNAAESAAHMTYDAVLSAIMDGIVADNVGADFLLAPTYL